MSPEEIAETERQLDSPENSVHDCVPTDFSDLYQGPDLMERHFARQVARREAVRLAKEKYAQRKRPRRKPR